MDTIGVQFPISIKQDHLQCWEYERKQKKNGSRSRYLLNIKTDNGCVVTYIYIPYTIGGYSILQVEFSLSHLVFEDNIYMVYDLKSAINQANSLLPNVPGIPKLDLWRGMLYRLDIPYNFQVGRLVPFYIKAAQSLELPRHKTRPYSKQGCQWANSQGALKIYDKERWYSDNRMLVNPDSQGILRLEDTLRKNKIKRLTHEKYPTLHDITIEMELDALEDELNQIALLNRSIGTYDTTMSKLREVYGDGDAAFCYFGVLVAKVEYPNRDTIIAASGIHPRALDRRLKKILDAGLPLTMTKCDEPLPALTIDREAVMARVKEGPSVLRFHVIPQAFNEPKVCNSLVIPEEIKLSNQVIK
jgi:hypothetical protein